MTDNNTPALDELDAVVQELMDLGIEPMNGREIAEMAVAILKRPDSDALLAGRLLLTVLAFVIKGEEGRHFMADDGGAP